jgi:hypothetical protein
METITDNCHIFSEGVTTTNKTIELEANGLLRGTGNKASTIHSTANPIIRVMPNTHNRFEKNALLENIVIEGDNATSSQIAIELGDVNRCYIKNVDIQNVDMGMRLRVNANNSAESNFIEQVQMINVNKGIQFYNNGTGKFSNNHIDNVSILLNDQENLTGIEICTGCTLAMPHIFASVTSTQNCTGMYVDGSVSGEFIQFSHSKDSENYGGVGVLLGENATVSDEYGHFVVSGRHLTAPLSNPYSITNYIVQNNSEGYAATVEDSANASGTENLIGNLNDGNYAAISASGHISVSLDSPLDCGVINLYGYNSQAQNSTIQIYASEDGGNWTLINEVTLSPGATPFWIDGGFSEDPFSYVKIQTAANSAVCIDSVRVEYQPPEE